MRVASYVTAATPAAARSALIPAMTCSTLESDGVCTTGAGASVAASVCSVT